MTTFQQDIDWEEHDYWTNEMLREHLSEEESASTEFWAKQEEIRLEEDYSYYLAETENPLPFEDWLVRQAENREVEEW